MFDRENFTIVRQIAVLGLLAIALGLVYIKYRRFSLENGEFKFFQKNIVRFIVK